MAAERAVETDAIVGLLIWGMGLGLVNHLGALSEPDLFAQAPGPSFPEHHFWRIAAWTVVFHLFWPQYRGKFYCLIIGAFTINLVWNSFTQPLFIDRVIGYRRNFGPHLVGKNRFGTPYWLYFFANPMYCVYVAISSKARRLIFGSKIAGGMVFGLWYVFIHQIKSTISPQEPSFYCFNDPAFAFTMGPLYFLVFGLAIQTFWENVNFNVTLVSIFSLFGAGKSKEISSWSTGKSLLAILGEKTLFCVLLMAGVTAFYAVLAWYFDRVGVAVPDPEDCLLY